MNKKLKLNKAVIRVLLVDDHAMLRKGMVLLLSGEPDIEVVGEAGDGEEAIAQVQALKPDVVVMDVSMPGLNGIEATRQIVAGSQQSKVIALSIHSSRRFIDDMLNAGAVGYLLKESAPEELLQGIRAVIRGDMYLSSAITGTVLETYIEQIPDESTENIPRENIGILQTKLHQPPNIADLVPRKKLYERLDNGRILPLILVSAPAGYGKSVLVSSWLNTFDWPSAWLSLQEDDSDLRQFLSYFVAAIDIVFPNACEHTSRLTNAAQLPAISILLASLSNELEKIETPFVLVLDDYYRIKSESPVNDLIYHLLEHPSLSLHLVIVTRRDPPLQLVTLRASGQVSELRMQDLCLTRAETLSLLEKTNIITASDEAMNNLQHEMEGWAAGLRLVALALASHQDQEAFLCNLSGGIQQTQAYLLQEVIARQPPEVQEYLLKTSILDRFCESLCETVCHPDKPSTTAEFNAESFIAELTEGNLFAISLDPQGEWFRYHHLFQYLLKRELIKQKSSREINTLHTRACEWFENQGLIYEAIQHAIDASDIEAAANIIERHRYTKLDEDQFMLVEHWLDLLPEYIKEQRIELLLAGAWVAYFRLHLDVIFSVITQIEAFAEEKPISSHCLAELNFFRSLIAYWTGQGEDSKKYAEQALKMSPFKQGVIQGEAEVYYAMARQMIGEGEAVITHLDNKIRSIEAHNHAYNSRLYAARMNVHLLSGDLALTLRDAKYLITVAEKWQSDYAMTWGYYCQAAAQFQAFDLKQAMRSFLLIKDKLYFFERRAAVDVLAAMALNYQFMGEPEHAKSTSREMLDLAREFGDIESITAAESAQTRLLLLQGSLLPTVDTMKLIDSEQQANELFFWCENPLITRMRLAIETGSEALLENTQQELVSLQSTLESVHLTCQLIDVHALQCMVLYRQGQRDAAIQKLQLTVSLAESGGWIRPFIELGEPMAKLLRHLADKKAGSDFLPLIFAKLKTDITQLSTINSDPLHSYIDNDSWDGEALTKREIDILKLLEQRLQNKEIAAKLFVSPETVKSHLKHLYDKLGVHNRREAAELASNILSSKKDVLNNTKYSDVM